MYSVFFLPPLLHQTISEIKNMPKKRVLVVDFHVYLRYSLPRTHLVVTFDAWLSHLHIAKYKNLLTIN